MTTIKEMLERLSNEFEYLSTYYNDEYHAIQFNIESHGILVMTGIEVSPGSIYVCYYEPKLHTNPYYYWECTTNSVMTLFRNEPTTVVCGIEEEDVNFLYTKIKKTLIKNEESYNYIGEFIEEIKELRNTLITEKEKFNVAVEKRIKMEKDFTDVFE